MALNQWALAFKITYLTIKNGYQILTRLTLWANSTNLTLAHINCKNHKKMD